MNIDGSDGSNRAEAERWCQIAGRLLEARDLVGCKRFAERSLDVDPLVEGVDQIIAAADVLLASQRQINNHLDWYSILQLQSTPDGPDFDAIRNAYRRLALLLHPDRNESSSAGHAFKLVCDAWAFLSDPARKKLYDDEVKIANHLGSNGLEKSTEQVRRQPSTPPPPPPSFWTMCSGCFRAFEYVKEYQNRTLVCQNCRRMFQATELPAAPPVVPGTDMYYCSWGLFPLGFPGAPVFNGVAIPEGTVCIPAFPGSFGKQPPGGGEGRTDVGGRNEAGSRGKSVDITRNRFVTRQSAASSATPPVAVRTTGRKPKKVLASKPKKQDWIQQQTGNALGAHSIVAQGAKNNDVPTAQNVNAGDFGGGFDMNSFSVDLDDTADVLGNLANLPFLKDDEIVIMR